MPTSTFPCNVEIVNHAHAVNIAGQSKPILNRFVYSSQLAPTGYVANIAVLAAAFKTAVSASWRAFLNSGYLDDYIVIRQLDDSGYPDLTVIPGLGSGSNGLIDDMVAPDLTAYIKLEGLRRGKNYLGGKHISPLSETYMKQGVLEAAGVTLLKAIQTALHVPISDGAQSFDMVIMSQNLSQVAVNPCWINASIADFDRSTVNKTLGTQRHRKYPRLIG